MQEEQSRWRQSELHKQQQAHELKQRFSRYLGRTTHPGGGSRKGADGKPWPVVRWFAVAVVAVWLVWKVFGR